MTQLCDLHLDDVDLPRSRSELDVSFVAALLPLRCLTRLVLSAAGEHYAFAAACQAQQLLGAWPGALGLGM